MPGKKTVLRSSKRHLPGEHNSHVQHAKDRYDRAKRNDFCAPRAEQNRYYYEVDEVMTDFRALFLNGVLTIYINGVEAVIMGTDFLRVPGGRYLFISAWDSKDYPIPFELVCETSLDPVTISNFQFLAPDENLQQVKQRYIYTEGEFTEDIASETYTYTFSPGYTYTYNFPKDENILNVPALTLGTPTADTGDMIKSWKNQSFIFIHVNTYTSEKKD